MELRQLEMLLAVVDSGSYKKAGENLHVSHSAIHRQMRILEDEIKDRVLVRAGRNVQITETGSLLVDVARRIQQEISNFRSHINEANKLQVGLLRIGTGNSILSFFLPPVLERFRKEFPKVEVQIITGSGDQVVNDVSNGRLDIGVVYSPSDMLPGEPAPKCELLYRDELVLAVGSGHSLSNRKTVSLDDAAEFPFILFPKTSHIRRLVDRLFAKSEINPRVAMELDNEEAMVKMVAVNMGIAFLSEACAASEELSYLRLRVQRMYCDVGLVFPRMSYLPRAAKEFARMCREATSTVKQTNLPPASESPS